MLTRRVIRSRIASILISLLPAISLKLHNPTRMMLNIFKLQHKFCQQVFANEYLVTEEHQRGPGWSSTDHRYDLARTVLHRDRMHYDCV